MQLTTNGSNLRGIWQFAGITDDSIIELETMYSNDIYSILKTYGVEMARAAILREISGVFDAYKIDVDGRHLELIADYMVRPSVAFHTTLVLTILSTARHLKADISHSTARVSRAILRLS